MIRLLDLSNRDTFVIYVRSFVCGSLVLNMSITPPLHIPTSLQTITLQTYSTIITYYILSHYNFGIAFVYSTVTINKIKIMDLKTFLAIKNKRLRLSNKYGTKLADCIIVDIMHRLNISPIEFLKFNN